MSNRLRVPILLGMGKQYGFEGVALIVLITATVVAALLDATTGYLATIALASWLTLWATARRQTRPRYKRTQ